MTEPVLLTADDIAAYLRAIRETKQPVGYDLEGSQFINCQAFALSPTRAFCIVTDGLGADSSRIWTMVAQVLEDAAIVKWVWNAHHELAVLRHAHGITLRGWEDGMARWFERFPDLKKGLKYAASILTRRPYWAHGIEFSDDDSGEAATTVRGMDFWRYNATDAAVTMEIVTHPQLRLTEAQEARYTVRKRLIEALTWASLHGIPYDAKLAARLRADLEPAQWEAQAEVDAVAGVTVPAEPGAVLAAAAREWCHAVKLRRYHGWGPPPKPKPAPKRKRKMTRIEAEQFEMFVIEQASLVAAPKPSSANNDLAPELAHSVQNERIGQASTAESVSAHTSSAGSGAVFDPRPALDWDAAIAIANDGGAEALASIRDIINGSVVKDGGTNPAGPSSPGNTGVDTVDHAGSSPAAATPLSAAARGRLASLLGLSVNVKSTKQVVALLNRFKLPKVFKRGANDAESQTKAADALLSVFLRTGHPITIALLKTIAIRTRITESKRQCSADGRMRSMFLSCGTETDRATSKEWLDGTGGNLTTIPDHPVNFRACYRPPEGHDWWKCDLTGADAWTVAARCATLGDDTMLLDLQAGLRIPTLLGLALEGQPINKLARGELAPLCKAFKRDWRDFAFKRVVYGSAYGMSPQGVRRVVIKDSFREEGSPRDPGLALCARLQALFFGRYWGVKLWHRDIERQLKATGSITAASGLTREFFGRRVVGGRVDEATIRQAAAFEPQANTTWQINRALDHVWTAADNRDRDGDPILKPVLTVHDELDACGPSERRDWCRETMTAAFTKPLTIGKVTVSIPFVLRWGDSWGTCKNI